MDAELPSRVVDYDGRWLYGGPARVEFFWTEDRFDSIEMIIDPETDSETVWPIDLTVLVDGLLWPAGLGDVAVIPNPWLPHVREIIIANPVERRRAVLVIDAADLHDYLMAVNELRCEVEREAGAGAG